MTRTIYALAVAGTLAAGTALAAPIQSATFTTDAAFLNFLSANGVTLPANEAFVAQARSGNNAGNGDYEIGLHIPPNFTDAGPVGTPGQQVWGSAGGANSWIDFTLSRVGTTLTFAMGSYSGVWNNALVGDVDALGFRVRSNSAGNSTRIQGLTFDGVALADPTLDATNGGLEFFVLSGITGDFTLEGEARLDWATGSIPNGSRLGFQIKGLDGFTPVPEPGSLALFGAALVGLAALRRRRTA